MVLLPEGVRVYWDGPSRSTGFQVADIEGSKPPPRSGQSYPAIRVSLQKEDVTVVVEGEEVLARR